MQLLQAKPLRSAQAQIVMNTATKYSKIAVFAKELGLNDFAHECLLPHIAKLVQQARALEIHAEIKALAEGRR